MIAKALRVALLSFTTVLASSASSISIEELPDPRPSAWVLDQAGELSTEAEDELNRLGARVKAETGAELVVVVVDTTGGTNPKSFALELFNRWGLGDRQRNDGLLVFAALEDRAAEILLGDGIDSDRNVHASEAIMRGEMVPRFKSGRAEEAILAGARSCAGRILKLTLEGAERASPRTLLEAPEAPQPAALEPETGEPGAASSPDGSPLRNGLAVTLALALLAGAGWLARKLTPGNERCPGCKSPMTELDETSDDAHLSAAEQTEERVGSVNWRVWMCTACTEVVKRPRKRWFSGYAACPSCGARTKNQSTTTLAQATTLQGGQVRIEERCAACTYSQIYLRATPILTRHSHTGGTSRGSSGGYRASGGGSSSGGGRSSGGGASGRW